MTKDSSNIDISMINKTQEDVVKAWPKGSKTPLVSIHCITYNHEQYIAQALNGFLEQITNFPFEIVIHDDASTDRTADIIREYEKKFPNVVRPIYETENQYSKKDGSIYQIMDAAIRGKYIAFCEGDDYWIDPLKLQKQIDFLEKNHDYGFTYTNAKGFDQKKQIFFDMQIKGLSGSFHIPMLKREVGLWTLTFCCRKELYYPKPVLDYKKYFCGDQLSFFYITSVSKGHFFPEITAIYRKLENSASHIKSKKKRSEFRFRCCNTDILFLNNTSKFEGKEKLLKKRNLQKISYCFYYHDMRAFKELNVPFFPIVFENVSKTIKYFFSTILFYLCKIKLFFEIGCFIANSFEKIQQKKQKTPSNHSIC